MPRKQMVRMDFSYTRYVTQLDDPFEITWRYQLIYDRWLLINLLQLSPRSKNLTYISSLVKKRFVNNRLLLFMSSDMFYLHHLFRDRGTVALRCTLVSVFTTFRNLVLGYFFNLCHQPSNCYWNIVFNYTP